MRLLSFLYYRRMKCLQFQLIGKGKVGWPLFAKPNGKQIWVLIIEKAWVKTIGNYFRAQAIHMKDTIDEISGSPTISGSFCNPQKIKQVIKYALLDKLIVLASKMSTKTEGIVALHAYSLLKIIEHKGSYIFKLRNPWGYFEWCGHYADASPQWTPELRKKCQQKDGDDGVFFMTERQLLQAFSNYAIELGQRGSRYSYSEFQCAYGQRIYLRFTLSQKRKIALKISQPFDAQLRESDQNYYYSPAVVELGKVQDNGDVRFIVETQCISKAAFIDDSIFKQYEAGEYFLKVQIQWLQPKKYNTAVFSIYCGEEVDIQRLQQTEGMRLWRKLIIDYIKQFQVKNLNKNISYQIMPMRAQTICYAVMNPTAQGDCFRVRWTFPPSEIKSSKITVNRLNDNAMEFIVTKKDKYNFGAYIKKQAISSGDYPYKYTVQSFKAEMPKENEEQIIRHQKKQKQQQVQPQKQQIQKKQKDPPKKKRQQPQKKQQLRKQEPSALDPRLSKLPQNIRQTYKAAKESGSFKDQSFPHCESSLGDESHQEKLQPFNNSLVWLRPSSFLDGNYTLFDGANPDDIRQGQIDTSYCLAALSNYARNPRILSDIFVFDDSEVGFYVLRFYSNGKPNYVFIDDYIPCDSSTNQPLFAFPVANKLWVLLIEKAWAKLFGSYFAAEALNSSPFMQDFSGAPTYGVWFEEQTNKTQSLIENAKKDYSIVLRAGETQIEGIVSNLDYSLLKVYQYKGSNIYKIRNPWAEFQWNGEYGENSKRWTAELKKVCDQRKGDDGVFFLSEKELLTAFVYYAVGLHEPNFKYSFTEFSSKAEESLYFRFKLSQKGKVAVRVTQPFKPTVADEEYEYSSAVFQLGKIESEGVTFLNEGDNKCSFGQKSMYASENIYDQYQAGEYFIRVKVHWVNPIKYHSGVLSVYCEQNIAIERLKDAEGFKLWKQMVYSFMQERELTKLDNDISYAIEWMKGQMICYAEINQNGGNSNYKVSWTFNPKDLVNCKLGLNKISESKIQVLFDKKERYNIGTVDSIQLSETSNSGTSQVHKQKI